MNINTFWNTLIKREFPFRTKLFNLMSLKRRVVGYTALYINRMSPNLGQDRIQRWFQYMEVCSNKILFSVMIRIFFFLSIVLPIILSFFFSFFPSFFLSFFLFFFCFFLSFFPIFLFLLFIYLFSYLSTIKDRVPKGLIIFG